jgi:hypothetical protein
MDLELKEELPRQRNKELVVPIPQLSLDPAPELDISNSEARLALPTAHQVRQASCSPSQKPVTVSHSPL